MVAVTHPSVLHHVRAYQSRHYNMTGRAAGLKTSDAVLPVQPDLTVFWKAWKPTRALFHSRRLRALRIRALFALSICPCQSRQHRGPSYGRRVRFVFTLFCAVLLPSALRLIRSFEPWKSCSRGMIHLDCGAPHSPRPALVVSIWPGFLWGLLVAGRQASWRFLETTRTRHDGRQKGGY